MISTIRALSRTILGKREWVRLKDTIGLSDKDFVYVLLDDDSIPVFIKNVKELKNKNGFGRLVAVVKTREHYNLLSGLNDVAYVYLMSENGMKRMAYYTVLFERIRNMQIVSLDVPFGRNGSKFEDLKGLSKEELITIGLFDLPMKSTE